jgi:hypothetical protein
MKRIMTAYAVVYLCMILLPACAMLGVPQADTFNKRVVQANGMVEVVANMVPVAFEAGKIDRDEARNTLEKLRITATSIDSAVLIRSTNPTEADANLTAAIAALTVIKSSLEARSK